jgi:hypothetical protein
MFNTFVLSLRPDDFRAVLAWGVAFIAVLAARVLRPLRRGLRRWLCAAGPTRRWLPRPVLIDSAHPAARLAARWTRDAEGRLTCRWERMRWWDENTIIVLPRRPTPVLPRREVA